MKKSDLIDTYAQSIGVEAAKELISKKRKLPRSFMSLNVLFLYLLLYLSD